MRHRNQSLTNLFNKVYKRKATIDEKELADRWYHQLELKNDPVFPNKEAEEQIRLRLHNSLLDHVYQNKTQNKIKRLSLWTKVAAAAIVLIVFSFGIYSLCRTSLTSKVFTAYSDSQHIKTVTLPDGTQVTLNKSARISWNSAFGKKDRKVELTGEAFFDVKKDKEHPFILKSENITTTVLGTAFNVESYANERQIKVSLVRGHVRINDQKEPQNHTELIPGQMMAYNKDLHQLEVRATAVEDPGAWVKGGYVFNNIPLESALSRLKENYHLVIKYDPVKIQGKTVTGTFVGVTWQESLHSILFMNDLDFRQENNVIYIK